ncbi:MAG TPA: adenylate kinase [Verrucomicrobiae bacterium]|jgi:adenylate kinase|nr:adenylate kinase [Verrucomicrobiae bacterium]
MDHSHALILLGPPGAGKGTQANLFAKRSGMRHLSTGDMFREAIRSGTPTGQLVEPILGRGELVPDAIVLKVVEERLAKADCAGGFVFDGFPRTLPQAVELDRIVKQLGFGKPIIVDIEVDPEILVRRLSGRWTCSVGGEIYNVYDAPPKAPGICDSDGGKLVQRPDDRVDVVRRRLAEYERQTKPLAEYYQRQGNLETVDGSASMEEVSRALEAIVERAKRRDGHL